MTAPAQGGGWSAERIARQLFVTFRGGLLAIGIIELMIVALPQVVGAGETSTRPLISFVLVTAVVVAAFTAILLGRTITAPFQILGVAVLLIATVVIEPTLPTTVEPLSAHWYFGHVGAYTVLLLLDRRLGVVGGALGILVTWYLGRAVVDGWTAGDVAGLAMVATGIAGVQFAMAVAARLIWRIARGAEEAAVAQEHLRVASAVAADAHAHHERRYADLRTDTVHLLGGLANGTLDPNDQEIRRRCAIEAARMRLLFAERDDVSDPLIHELRAGVDVAERGGLSVDLAVRGRPRDVPNDVRRGLLEPVFAAILSARSTARVTVLRLADHIRVSVYSEDSEQPTGNWSHPDVRVNVVAREQIVWTETTWRGPISP